MNEENHPVLPSSLPSLLFREHLPVRSLQLINMHEFDKFALYCVFLQAPLLAEFIMNGSVLIHIFILGLWCIWN